MRYHGSDDADGHDWKEIKKRIDLGNYHPHADKEVRKRIGALAQIERINPHDSADDPRLEFKKILINHSPDEIGGMRFCDDRSYFGA